MRGVVLTDGGPMIVGASDELLVDQLREIDLHLDRIGVDRSEVLNNGLDEGAVEAGLASIALPVPSEIRMWFGWANGGRVGLPTMPLPASLQEALGRYPANGTGLDAAVSGGYDYEAEKWGAPEGWIRLQASSYAVAVECEVPTTRRPRLRVASVDFGESTPKVNRTAVSLCSLAELNLIGFRADAFEWEPRGKRWRIDKAAFVRERERIGWPPESLF